MLMVNNLSCVLLSSKTNIYKEDERMPQWHATKACPKYNFANISVDDIGKCLCCCAENAVDLSAVE